ncbi:hypothetical protein IMSHALPRED_007766 [Imshaugia aleurites]|uniref:Uncharacterized protein n=1 Tax=Imshaugia aleurites TaxID=172621 RepID=A0A8H3FWV1_9LECA|nr:hypothetical protein IMSHALPRED_007766 [Imshaugia aleurites]
MFGGPQAPPSKAELKVRAILHVYNYIKAAKTGLDSSIIAEDEAFQTVKQVAAASILLYLSPFVIDYVKKLV